ncbi:MAG: hypothetical protein JWM11_6205 [Planctomycetaceae bacterium]|nr:hypothetical protein [Planctomycetaceae bacterium]
MTGESISAAARSSWVVARLRFLLGIQTVIDSLILSNLQSQPLVKFKMILVLPAGYACMVVVPHYRL